MPLRARFSDSLTLDSIGIHTAEYGGQMGVELSISGVSDYEEIERPGVDESAATSPSSYGER